MVPEIPLLKYFFRKSDQSTQSYRLGIENSYGHPHRETIERLEKTGSRILATANCGGFEITVEFGGKIQYTLKEGSETTAYEESE